MNYEGKELREYRSKEPVFFDPPKRMLCWDDDTNRPVKCLAFSYDGRMSMPVVAAQEASTRQIPEAWPHCAEIPEEYYALVVVEHRAVSGINRYGLGKFVTRDDAKLVMDSMVKLLGGDPKMGSKDIYVVPFDAVRGFPYGAYDNRMDMDRIPNYLVDAYDEAMKNFLGEEDTGRPRIKDLRENVGIAQKVENCNITFEARQALARELRAKTGINYIRCKQTLEHCGWIYNEAYYKLMGEYPTGEAPQEPTDECSSTKKETVQHVMEIDEMVGKSDRITDLMYRTGWGPYHCKKALEACGWKPVAAERMLKEKFKDFVSNK